MRLMVGGVVTSTIGPFQLHEASIRVTVDHELFLKMCHFHLPTSDQGIDLSANLGAVPYIRAVFISIVQVVGTPRDARVVGIGQRIGWALALRDSFQALGTLVKVSGVLCLLWTDVQPRFELREYQRSILRVRP